MNSLLKIYDMYTYYDMTSNKKAMRPTTMLIAGEGKASTIKKE